MAEQSQPIELTSPPAATAGGRFSCRNPQGIGAHTPALSEEEQHRRLWLRHALQTPQPAELNPQPEQSHVPIRT